MTRGVPQNHFPSRRISWMAMGIVVLAAGSIAAPRLEDIVLDPNPAQVELRFAAPATDAPAEFPAFFQKVDSSRKIVLLSFLETETSLPFGEISLPPHSPVQSVELKRLRSPSGKIFLGITFMLLNPTKSDWEPKPMGTSALVIALGKVLKHGAMKKWSLAQAGSPASHSAPEQSPSPEAETVKPKATVSPASEPSTNASEVAPVKTAVATPPSDAAAPIAQHLLEIRVSTSAAKEEVIFVFKGKGIPDYKLENPAPDPRTLALTLRNVISDTTSEKFDLGGSGWVKGLRWKQVESDLGVVLLLDSSLTPKATAKAGQLVLTFPRRLGAAVFTWDSRHPAASPRPAPEPLPSAFAEGKELEKRKPTPLSSSRIFTLAETGMPMMVLKDSTPFLSKPEKNAKAHRFLSAGETVRRLESRGGYVRVATEADTGYVKPAALAYADELGTAQMKEIQTKVQARAQAQAAPPAPEKPVAAEKPSAPVTPAPATVVVPPPATEPPPPAPVPASNVKSKVASRIPAATKTPVPKLSMAASGEESKMNVSPEAMTAEQMVADSEKIDLVPRNEHVTYNSFGRRDPFIPVDQGSLDNGIDIDEMKVVGIVWEGREPMAVLENVKESNLSFTVRQGDPVHNGRVGRITRDAVTFDLTEFGITRSYTLKLVPSQERAGK